MNAKYIEVDGVRYVPQEDKEPSGPRHLLIVDRGWVFCGDLSEADGRIKLERAVMVRSWSKGLEALTQSAANAKVELLAAPVDVPAEAELFRIPVDESWGL